MIVVSELFLSERDARGHNPSPSWVEELPGHRADLVEEMQGVRCLSARHGP
jgi:hypothetical protein